MRLLIVEDDRDLNRQLCAALELAGYVVDRAFDGEEGHFLGDTEPYDAIVIMGVIEHLPDYARVLDKFQALLRPGGRIFLDGSACTRKYELSSYMVKYIYGGNHSFLVLHDFLDKLARTRLEVTEIFNDRYSYFLTFKQWAQNFERNREFVIQRFGEFNYRRFRLYLWGARPERGAQWPWST